MRRSKVEWPQRTCRDAVWGDDAAHWCELPDLHQGPCMSLSVRDSVIRRDQWERAFRRAPKGQDDDSKGISS